MIKPATEYQIVWHCPDGTTNPSAGVWPTKEAAIDAAERSIRELIGPSTKYVIHEVTWPNLIQKNYVTEKRFK